MAGNILTVGTRVKLNIKYSESISDEVLALSFVSKIVEIKENAVIVAMPIAKADDRALEAGTVMDAYFYTKQGIYKADVKIAKKAKAGNVFIMALLLGSTAAKLQRREYYRLPCSIQADIMLMKPDEVLRYLKFRKGPIEDPTDKCIIMDLSGGGAKLLTSLDVEIKEHFYILFTLGEGRAKQAVELMGEVISAVKPSEEKEEYCEYRVKFKAMSMQMRDAIMKYIYEQQRIEQKNERGRKLAEENIDN